MHELQRHLEIDVSRGAMPSIVLGPEDASEVPGLLVVPSIFGPARDLIERLSPFAERALVVVPDPFWRIGGGPVPYADHQTALARLTNFDRALCLQDLQTALQWTRSRCNGRVYGLGICFGGPFMLLFARDGALSGLVTWHGSRMESFLEGAPEITCPMRLHFGSDDPITPPAAIEAIRQAFREHPDIQIVVHSGAVHGFSHDGPSYDEKACQAGLDALEELIRSPA